MKSFSFLHTADLHLDSPFHGLQQIDSRMARLLRESTFQAFDNVLDLALRREVDFVLVAGDVYDGRDRSLRAQLKFNSGLQQLAAAGIRSFVCHGNHDPLDGWSASLQWPSEVYVFGPHLESVVVPVAGEPLVRIHGISYPHSQIDRSFGLGFRRMGREPFQIALFHCSVGEDPAHETYAPRSIADLQSADLDYWALGHVHRQRILMHSQPFIGYPGNTQGRQIRESGARGCFLVEVNSSGQVQVTFEPVDAVRWLSKRVDISTLEREVELVEALERVCEESRDQAESRPAIVRITLVGRGPLHASLRRPGFVEDLTEQIRETGLREEKPVWVEKLVWHTSPAIDIASRRQAADFIGETLRVIESYRGDYKGLLEVLQSLYHDRRGRIFLQMPQQEELVDMIREAETLCLDELIGGEGQ
ncbi:MAG: DNA repair exonuclease [Deltaproteobacteria bacterium]|nr:DNA repair exonuclease [Deltaproteobacteria bacterium]MBW2069916.1 DNA repair exonuclease [Deltaproteobacteria bacterium]